MLRQGYNWLRARHLPPTMRTILIPVTEERSQVSPNSPLCQLKQSFILHIALAL